MNALDIDVEVGHPLVRGALALYPLFGKGPKAGEYLPGPVAAADLIVEEMADGPSVPHLSVTNSAGLPVLLLEGESLLGGWQNRTLNVSLLLAAGQQATVPVTCVERGRWSGSMAGARPAPAMAPSLLRERKARSVAAGVVGGGFDKRADQGDVWAAVDEYSARLKVSAPTAALADVQAARHGDVNSMVEGTSPLAGQRGIAAAVGSRVVSIDLFDRPSTLAAYWSTIVQGYALDAVGLLAPPTSPPGRRAVVKTFDALRSSLTRKVPGVCLGDEIHATSPSVVAGALVWEDVCLHLAVHAAA